MLFHWVQVGKYFLRKVSLYLFTGHLISISFSLLFGRRGPTPWYCWTIHSKYQHGCRHSADSKFQRDRRKDFCMIYFDDCGNWFCLFVIWESVICSEVTNFFFFLVFVTNGICLGCLYIYYLILFNIPKYWWNTYNCGFKRTKFEVACSVLKLYALLTNENTPSCTFLKNQRV